MAARSKQSQALKVANRAYQLAKRNQASQERKYVITVFERTPIINTGALFALNETVQDDGDVGQRVGDQIRCVRLRYDLQFVQPPALAGSNSLRMAIVVDKQNTMANAGALWIGVGTNHAPLLQYTKDYRLQFAVVLDTFAVNLDTYNPSKCMHCDRKLELNTRYLQDTDQILTGSLKAIFISSVAGTIASGFPAVTGSIRVDYTDN
jgi:hypothetical protein